MRGNIEVMEKIWEWAKEKLKTQEIKKNCYYAQTLREGTPGILQHIAANLM
jgi:hypothetical protein